MMSEEKTDEEEETIETEESIAESTEPKRRETPNFSYMIRIFAGVYLLYIASSLFLDENKQFVTENIWYVIISILYGIIGAVLVVLSVRSLYKKYNKEKMNNK